jgi:serine/threonine protein kinase
MIGQYIGNHRLVERIGVGGMGVIYRATHTNLDKQYAIKFLHPQFASDEEVVERFRREAQVIAALDHDNIIRASDFGWLDGFGFYLVMEYLQGVTLKELIKREGALDLQRIIDIYEQLLDALDVAHEQGIVHRDLKPENLFLLQRRGREQLKILDFGIARIAFSEKQRDFTMDGEVYGSPTYMSPEQARGDVSKVDPRADLYSTGVILIEALTGRPPYHSKTPAEIMLAHISTLPPRLSDLFPQRIFAPELEDVVLRSLAKEPEDRFQSAGDLFKALEPALKKTIDLNLARQQKEASDKKLDIAATQISMQAISEALSDQDLPTGPIEAHIAPDWFQQSDDDNSKHVKFAPQSTSLPIDQLPSTPSKASHHVQPVSATDTPLPQLKHTPEAHSLPQTNDPPISAQTPRITHDQSSRSLISSKPLSGKSPSLAELFSDDNAQIQDRKDNDVDFQSETLDQRPEHISAKLSIANSQPEVSARHTGTPPPTHSLTPSARRTGTPHPAQPPPPMPLPPTHSLTPSARHTGTPHTVQPPPPMPRPPTHSLTPSARRTGTPHPAQSPPPMPLPPAHSLTPSARRTGTPHPAQSPPPMPLPPAHSLTPSARHTGTPHTVQPPSVPPLPQHTGEPSAFVGSIPREYHDNFETPHSFMGIPTPLISMQQSALLESTPHPQMMPSAHTMGDKASISIIPPRPLPPEYGRSVQQSAYDQNSSPRSISAVASEDDPTLYEPEPLIQVQTPDQNTTREHAFESLEQGLYWRPLLILIIGALFVLCGLGIVWYYSFTPSQTTDPLPPLPKYGSQHKNKIPEARVPAKRVIQPKRLLPTATVSPTERPTQNGSDVPKSPKVPSSMDINDDSPSVQVFRLTIDTTPQGADIFLEGQGQIAQTPYILQLPQGSRVSLQVRKKGYLPQSVEWRAEQHNVVNIKLVRDPS